jgi:hypothetical protein
MIMSTSESTTKRSAATRYALGVLMAFGALNAFGGGWYGMSGAPNVPKEWLSGTPFRDYFIPSLLLFTVVGGAFLVGAVASFARLPFARAAALAAAVVVLVWIATQVSMIGYVSWMQPTTAAAGVLMLVLASRLPRATRPETLA